VVNSEMEREVQPSVSQVEVGKSQYTQDTELCLGTGPCRAENFTGASSSVHLLPPLLCIPDGSPSAVTLSTGLDT